MTAGRLIYMLEGESMRLKLACKERHGGVGIKSLYRQVVLKFASRACVHRNALAKATLIV